MDNLNKKTQDELKRLIDQIERLEAERAALGADVRDKFTEAKNRGFDPKILRKVLALRKKPQIERENEEALIATYLHALGWETTPLASRVLEAAE
jgi:uncharacterized protein (UPF0335 family)